MPSLNKHQIMLAVDTVTKSVEVPEWGGTVKLKTLSLGEGIKFQETRKLRPETEVTRLLLAYTLVDDMGKPLFGEDELDDLGEKNPKVLDRLFYESLELNRMGPGSDEDREKNS